MIAEILPPQVAAEEAFGDLPAARLYPGEEAIIANAVDKRRREFTTARACARAALARLGVPAAPILSGLRGSPQWPAGVVGSITHCAGYRAAAAGLCGELITIGMDAEPHEALPDGVLEAVSAPGERARLAALAAARPETSWDRLLFCAKEAVYKAWFPLTQRWLGFEDADIDFFPADRTFTARLLVDGPVVNGSALTAFSGRWQVSGGLITTAIVIPRKPPA